MKAPIGLRSLGERSRSGACGFTGSTLNKTDRLSGDDSINNPVWLGQTRLAAWQVETFFEYSVIHFVTVRHNSIVNQ